MPIYICQAGAGGPVKIGFSKDVKRRIEGLQTGQAVEVVLLRVLDGTPTEERQLHQRFLPHRIKGEWFKPCADLLFGNLGLQELPLSAADTERPKPAAPRPVGSPPAEVRARMSELHLAIWADPVRGAQRRERVRASRMRSWLESPKPFSDVVARAGGKGRVAQHLGVPVVDVAAWKAIPADALAAVADLARVPVSYITHLAASEKGAAA